MLALQPYSKKLERSKLVTKPWFELNIEKILSDNSNVPKVFNFNVQYCSKQMLNVEACRYLPDFNDAFYKNFINVIR